MYFYDLGVRHALINNFNPLGMRNDSGPILENYFIAEKVKAEANLSQKANFFFWRTYERHEIDLISEKNGQISAFEIQIKGKPRPTARAIFQAAYPASRFHPVTLDNFSEYLSSPRER
jgi:predicted AAA+ superfamily ATPase